MSKRVKYKNKFMRNREATLRKIDSIDSGLNKIVLTLNQGNREACYETIDSLREQLDQLRTYIDIEPITGNELNRIS
jgi:hypothetical protein